jgi:hypothetical protein
MSSSPHRARDNALVDAVEAIPPIHYKGRVWRVVREGKGVLLSSAVGGRWDDGTFDVLYTSEKADGAIAEMHFHLNRGQPVTPSRVRYRLYQLKIEIGKALRLADLDAIARLNVDISRYGGLSYNDRHQEYPRTQEIAETAHFLGFDGLIAPNARWNCMNVVLFTDRLPPECCEIVKDHGPILWDRWLAKPFGY